jgi:hypothetical protein
MDHETTGGGDGVDRRRLLLGAAVSGGLAWAAPTVLSSAAHAQGTTPPTTDVPPTTGAPPAFAPVALGGMQYGFAPLWIAADAGGRLRTSGDLGATWADALGGGALGAEVVGANQALFGGGAMVVTADGTTWRPTGPATWAPWNSVGMQPVAIGSVSIAANFLAVDASGACRFGGLSPFVDPGLGTLDIVPIAVAGLGLTTSNSLMAVSSGGRVRLAREGAAWIDPLAGGTLDVVPAGLAMGATTTCCPDNTWLVVGSGGEVRRSGDYGATWTDPLAGGSVGLQPIALSGITGGHMVVDASGNLRVSTDNGGSWSTPAGSPIT